MGWKNVKEHYRIGHIVCVTEKGICIGSSYIHDIIVINPDGALAKQYDRGSAVNTDLGRYQSEMLEDPEKLRELINTPDTFERSLTVYTYQNGDILEKQCEEYGYPNVTHDGMVMYENRFHQDKETVVRWAKRNAAAGVELLTDQVWDAEQRLKERKDWLAAEIAFRNKLEYDYPYVVIKTEEQQQ